jgi:alpha-L-rhamnosidase
MDHKLAGAFDVPSFSWTADMVRPLADQGEGHPASYIEKRFRVSVVRGTEELRISALGLYRAFINGKRVGDDLLTPGWTAYDKRLSYQTYPVSDLLVPGENVITIWLADGWLRSPMMWGGAQITNTWGDKIAAIAELHRNDSSGEILVATDASWCSGELPVRRSGIYYGEDHDGRFVGEANLGVATLPFDTSILIAHETKPVREMHPLAPQRIWRDTEGRWLYDFAQNLAGYVTYSVIGAAGSTVTVEHGEVLDKDGEFYNGNLRLAEARTRYTLSGRGIEHYRPTFTFHGYRYARVTITGAAEIKSISSVPISSLPEQAGGFTCGNELVNRLVLNTLWSLRSNFVEVPTDCPQRDERLGWTGDAQVFAGTACYLSYAHDFLKKWLRDVMADQREDGAVPHVSPDPTRQNPSLLPGFYGSTGWGDAIAIVPWQLYLHFGDTSILSETLSAMVRWVDFVWSISDGPIVHPPRHVGMRGFTHGDWLQPSGPSTKPMPTIGDDAAATIYLYISASTAARAATVVGDNAVAERMRSIATEVKAAFQREFISSTGRLVYDDQTSYALAIAHDLIPEEHRAAARRYFTSTIARADGRIGTGFIGTPALLPALLKIGEPALAAAVFLQEEVPGWLYQVKLGATTIWERWDAIQADGSIYNPEMNSYNHYAYGSVCQWLFEEVAGFAPVAEAPGFRVIRFKPAILPELSPVSAWYESSRGRIEAGWSVNGAAVIYDVLVPPGCEGWLELPKGATDIVVDGGPSEGAPLQSGRHRITFNLPHGGARD